MFQDTLFQRKATIIVKAATMAAFLQNVPFEFSPLFGMYPFSANRLRFFKYFTLRLCLCDPICSSHWCFPMNCFSHSLHAKTCVSHLSTVSLGLGIGGRVERFAKVLAAGSFFPSKNAAHTSSAGAST